MRNGILLALARVGPWMLAAFLYLGAGLGLAVIQLFRRLLGLKVIEAPLRAGG
jgi:hypothetical protein